MLLRLAADTCSHRDTIAGTTSPRFGVVPFNDHQIVGLMSAVGVRPSPPPRPAPESPEAPRRRTAWGPMPARDCPAAGHSGATRDAPRDAARGTHWGRAGTRRSAGPQVRRSAGPHGFRIPDFQVPHARAAPTPPGRGRVAPGGAGGSGNLEPGDLPRAQRTLIAHDQRGLMTHSGFWCVYGHCELNVRFGARRQIPLWVISPR